jgi:hypothetical protein
MVDGRTKGKQTNIHTKDINLAYKTARRKMGGIM